MSRATRTDSLWRIFRWPLLLGAVSVLGLIGALVGNQAWDALSWLCLGSLPVLVLVLYNRKRVTG
jgi:hypothetical protein